MVETVIRSALESDLPQLTNIFNHYILAEQSFDTEAKTLDERRSWFASYGEGAYQLLVAEDDDRILGCAYSSRYRQHPAFDKTVETSIYLDPATRGRGIGTRLYSVLLARLEAQDVHLAVAGIALPNDASVGLHRKLGYSEVGVFNEYAFVRGKFESSVWLQRRVPLQRTSGRA